MGALGEKFRQERERRGFSLDDVSNVTKISSRMLQAIEKEHFDQLPGGVFNKGFVRAYAKHLGLNDEEAVSEYLACLRQAQVDAENAVWQHRQPNNGPGDPRAAYAKPVILQSAAATDDLHLKPVDPKPPAPPKVFPKKIVQDRTIVKPASVKPVTAKAGATKPASKQKPAPPAKPANPHGELPDLQLPIAEHVRPKRYMPMGKPGIPWKIPAAIAAVILLVILLWIRHSHSAQAEGTNTSHPPAASSSTSASSPAPVASNTTSTPSPGAPSKSPTAPVHNTPPAASSSVQAAGRSTVDSVDKDRKDKSDKSSDTNTSDVTKIDLTKAANKKDAASQSGGAASPTKNEPAKPLPTFTVVIRATENLHVSVAADGQTVREETLIAPAYTSVKATREVVVKAANGGAVSFSFNGKEVQIQAQEGQAKTFEFDSNGLKTGAETSTPNTQ